MPKFTGTSSDDVIVGSPRADTIYGKGGSDNISGGSGNDLIFGGGGVDYVDGGDGDDTIYGDHDGALIADSLGDFLTGGAGNDFIGGGAGDDTIGGGTGNDDLWGDQGDDKLSGDAGEDRFNDFWGADIMYGGAWGGTGDGARDVFDYDFAGGSNTAYGIDFVADFETGIDVIDLSGMDANLLTPVSTPRKGPTTGLERFTYVGTDSETNGTTPGHLTLTFDGVNTTLRGYLDDQAGADFIIVIAGQVDPSVDIVGFI